jgi:hypothetical protein
VHNLHLGGGGSGSHFRILGVRRGDVKQVAYQGTTNTMRRGTELIS